MKVPFFSGPPQSLSGTPQICSFKNWCVFFFILLYIEQFRKNVLEVYYCQKTQFILAQKIIAHLDISVITVKVHGLTSISVSRFKGQGLIGTFKGSQVGLLVLVFSWCESLYYAHNARLFDPNWILYTKSMFFQMVNVTDFLFEFLKNLF